MKRRNLIVSRGSCQVQFLKDVRATNTASGHVPKYSPGGTYTQAVLGTANGRGALSEASLSLLHMSCCLLLCPPRPVAYLLVLLLKLYRQQLEDTPDKLNPGQILTSLCPPALS